MSNTGRTAIEACRDAADGPPPRPRVILLGASNLTKGFGLAVETARLLLGGPLEVMAAMGHGRSYGIPSNILGRVLPGIEDCGLWRALRERPPAPAFALITDIGNDILYGVEPAVIAGWVERSIERFESAGARVSMSLLPAARLRLLTPRFYRLARGVLFPTRSLPFTAAMERIRDLQERLRILGRARGAALIEPALDWYGIDPIHIRPRQRPAAWRALMAPWAPARDGVPLARRSVRRRLETAFLRPERWWLLGIDLHGRQPCRRRRDGTTIALY